MFSFLLSCSGDKCEYDLIVKLVLLGWFVMGDFKIRLKYVIC